VYGRWDSGLTDDSVHVSNINKEMFMRDLFLFHAFYDTCSIINQPPGGAVPTRRESVFSTHQTIFAGLFSMENFTPYTVEFDYRGYDDGKIVYEIDAALQFVLKILRLHVIPFSGHPLCSIWPAGNNPLFVGVVCMLQPPISRVTVQLKQYLVVEIFVLLSFGQHGRKQSVSHLNK